MTAHGHDGRDDHTSLRALVLCGGGSLADQWHDLAATGQAVAELLGDLGVRATLSSRLADAVIRVDGGRLDTDLLVVNCSHRAEDTTPDPDAGLLTAAIDAHVAAGRPVLGLHSASIAFPDIPRWGALLGARWREGFSMHPDLGPTAVQVHPDAHPLASGLADVQVEDERYTHLVLDETLGAVIPYLTHEHEGVTHPLAWARELGPSQARIVYDALGHDVRSYRSPTRRALLAAEVRWLISGPTAH